MSAVNEEDRIICYAWSDLHQYSTCARAASGWLQAELAAQVPPQRWPQLSDCTSAGNRANESLGVTSGEIVLRSLMLSGIGLK